jgi:hypothetical protein
LIVLMGASRIHLPRWSVFGLAVLVVAIGCLISGSMFLSSWGGSMMLVFLVALVLLVGTILGMITASAVIWLTGSAEESYHF